MSYSTSVPYNGLTIDECAQKARNASVRLGWGCPRECPGKLFISVPISLFSWGEEFTVTFLQDRMVIESHCSNPLQIIDWGKNKKNVAKFLEMFDRS